jgi:hypothetical protein
MEEQPITLETAKLAKEKKYEGYIDKCYDPECLDPNHIFNWWTEHSCSTSERMQRLLNAPTQTILQKWFREIHGIEVFVKPFLIPQLNREGSFKYYGLVVTINCVAECDKGTECKDKYEDAFEEALKLAFELIK